MEENKSIDEPYLEKSQEIFDEAYNKLEKFLYKSKTEDEIIFNDLKINGKRLFIDRRESIEEKIIPFWHLASQGKDELKYDMYPCENHELKKFCVQKCEFDTEDNFLKDIGLYNENPNDPRIQKWTIKEKDGKHLKIRFIDKQKDIDYIIIMRINYCKGMTNISQYRLITAYPVIMKSYKRRFDREYRENEKK